VVYAANGIILSSTTACTTCDAALFLCSSGFFIVFAVVLL